MRNVASKAAVVILSWRGPSGNLITEGPRYERNKQVAALKAMRNATFASCDWTPVLQVKGAVFRNLLGVPF